MKKKIILIFVLLIISLFSSISVYSTCTVTLDKTSYHKQETAVGSNSCDEVAEKNKPYSVEVWNITSGQILANYTGTTPNSVGEIFTEPYTIPSDFGGTGINFSLTVDGTWKAYDNASVTASASNDLLITSALVAGKWLGLSSSVKATVKDENDALISGGNCKMSIWSNDATQMLQEDESQLYNGELKFIWTLDYEDFSEGVDYFVKLICDCGDVGTLFSCRGSGGVNSTELVGSSGITIVPFTTNTWLDFDVVEITYSNGTTLANPNLYAGFDSVNWRTNITNHYPEQLEGIVSRFIINNATGQSYGEVITERGTVGTGNGSRITSMKLPIDLDSGIYKVRSFVSVLFNNIQVAQYIRESPTFNVTDLQDTFIINDLLPNKSH